MTRWLRSYDRKLRPNACPSDSAYGDRLALSSGDNSCPSIPNGRPGRLTAKSLGDSRMELYELLEHVVLTFERLQIPYLITGSVAAMAYGEPRLTNDIDLVAAIETKHIAAMVAAFPAPSFYLSDEAIRAAIAAQTQFNIIHPTSGLKIDVMVRKDTPFDRSRFARARTLRPSESYPAAFASAEDVIIKKMEFYKEGGSEKHLRDITGMLKMSDKVIDRTYIQNWAKTLNLTEIWEAILGRLQEKG